MSPCEQMPPGHSCVHDKESQTLEATSASAESFSSERERFRRLTTHDFQMFSVHWNPQRQLHQHAGPLPTGPEVCIQQFWEWGPEILLLFNKYPQEILPSVLLKILQLGV